MVIIKLPLKRFELTTLMVIDRHLTTHAEKKPDIYPIWTASFVSLVLYLIHISVHKHINLLMVYI
jgi:hypothetical protein